MERCDPRMVSGVRRLVLGSKRPAHSLLGGVADVVLCKNRMASMMVLLWITAIWILVKWGGFKVLPLICYSLTCASLIMNFQSEVQFVTNKLYTCFKRTYDGSYIGSQPTEPTEAYFSYDLVQRTVRVSEFVIEEVSKAFQCTGLEKNFTHFIIVNAVFWLISIVSSWFDFVTLLYMVFLVVYAALALYGSYEDDIDSAIVKILYNIHRHYLVLNATILNTFRRFHFMKMRLR